ncbi:hypothetical protein [Glycomyces sp. NPDC048151]|uniref:hypothetical protein n=1 Tax=Glycomyces sp. NPDC048151 TaxID=3364002 RepID=UPI00371C8F7B
MGSRSLTTLTFPRGESAHFYLHWGSPHYQVPNVAAYVWETWSQGLDWTLKGYRDYVAALKIQDLPIEEGWDPKDANRSDLEHLYTYTFTEHGQVAFTYANRPIGGRFKGADSGASRLDLYQAAMRWRRELRSNVYRRLHGHGLRSGIEDYDLELIEAEFRIASEARPGAAESASAQAFHRAHECPTAGCGRPLTLDSAAQP